MKRELSRWGPVKKAEADVVLSGGTKGGVTSSLNRGRLSWKGRVTVVVAVMLRLKLKRLFS